MTLQQTQQTHASLRRTAVLDLESHLLGELIRPAHDDYDSARQVYNRAADRHPALIVRTADAADVIRAVTFARDNELPLAVRSGGHSMAGHSTVDDGLVIDLSRMRGLSMRTCSGRCVAVAVTLAWPPRFDSASSQRASCSVEP